MSRRFSKGDYILSEEPFVFAVEDDLVRTMCSHCLNLRGRLTRCCSNIAYCSHECARQDRENHVVECMMNNRNRPLIHEQRLIVRMLFKLALDRHSGTPTVSDFYGHKREFGDLEMQANFLSDKDKERHLAVTAEMRELLPKGVRQHLPDKVITLALMRLAVNKTLVMSHDYWPPRRIATALYLVGSMLPHTCEQIDEYVTFFEGRKMVIRALRDFTVDDVREIRIHRVNVQRPMHKRQEELLLRYYILCDCRRCMLQARDPTHTPDAFEAAIPIIDKLARPKDDMEELVQQYTDAIKLLDSLKYVPDTNFYANRLMHQLQLYSFRLGNHEKSVKFGISALKGRFGELFSRATIAVVLCISMARMGMGEPEHPEYPLYTKTVEIVETFFWALGSAGQRIVDLFRKQMAGQVVEEAPPPELTRE